MAAKHVLLTGAGGFVGSHVLRHFLERTDWRVTVTDSFRRVGNFQRISEQVRGEEYRGRLAIEVEDLRTPFSPQLQKRLDEVDYIVSIASDSDVDRSITHPRDTIENNVSLMCTLLQYARAVKPQKFLHLSTDEVYGPAADGVWHAEGERHRPSNPYSASKACQEDICYAYWRTYGVPLVIVNSMNLIGEMQHANKFVPGTLAKVMAGDEVQIHSSPEGKVGSRHYLHARNLADALLFILQHAHAASFLYGADGNDLLRLNVVGEREVDNLTMARMIADFAGRPLRHRFVDFHTSRPGHDARYALDGRRLADLGWKAPLSLEDSLQRTVKWTLENPEWLVG